MQIQTQSDETHSYTQFEGEQSGAQSPFEEKTHSFEDYAQSFEDNFKKSEEFLEEQNLCENATKLYKEIKFLDESLQFKEISFEPEGKKRGIQEILQALENKLSKLSDFNKKKEELKKNFEERKETNLNEKALQLARRSTVGAQSMMASLTVKLKNKTEHQLLNSLRDIIWEPQTLFERLQNLFQGCIEPIYMLIVGLTCLYSPSFVSFAYYLACIQHHMFMLYNIKVRFLNGLKVQAFVFVVLLIFIFTKIVYLRDLYRDTQDGVNKGLIFQVKRKTKSLFNDDLQFYRSFGFSLTYDDKRCSVNFDNCFYEVDILQSFTFEHFMLQLNVLFCIYLWLAHQKIKKLFEMKAYKLKHYKKLEAHFNKKSDEEESDLDLSEDSEGEEFDRRNSIVKSNTVTFGVEERQKDKEKLQKYMRLKKEVKKNFVESKYFFSWKHTFYVVGVLSQLIGSMIRKNILELPFIFLILICLAFYFSRRNYQRQYWIYQLYLVKFIQRTNILKQLAYIILCLEYVQSYLSSEHSAVKSIIQVIFGQDKFFSFEKVLKSESSNLRLVGYFLITIDLFLMHGFYLCLSLEIRDKFGIDLTFSEQSKRQIDCISQRTEDDAKLNEDFNNYQPSVQLAPEINKKNEQPNSNQEEFYDNQERKMKRLSKKDNTFETEILITLFSRILMFILAYMYHSAGGFVCLIWLLISFMLPSQVYKLVSIFIILPILCIQFTLIYGIRTQVLRETWFFQTFGTYYDWEMKNESLEFIFMSIVILCYMSMVSLHFDKLSEQQPKYQLLDFFKKKIENKNSSQGWKLAFLASKYLYVAVLAWLFFQSFMFNFANLLAMEYLFFFLLYTSSSWLYRNTSFLIIWFISIDILGQYYCSLIWPFFQNVPTLINTFYWLDFFPYENYPLLHSDVQTQYDNLKSESLLTQENPFKIKNSQDLYFRLEANYLNWLTLLMIVLCRYLNTMYKDKESRNKVVDLTEETQIQFKEKNPRMSYLINNFEKYFFTVVNHLLTYILIVWQVVFLETNLITWVFFFLNMLSLAFQLKNNKTQQSHKRVQKAFGFIKFYSAIIIVLHVTFVIFLGDLPKILDYHKEKLNYKFMKAYPEYYQYLNLIGFRSIIYDYVDYDYDKKEIRDLAIQVSTMKLSYYVGAFLIATYCENFFYTQSKETEAEENFIEDDYKKLFEYKIQDETKENKDQESKDNEELDQSGEKQHTKAYTKKRFYRITDFVKFYEKQTFSTPYYVYTLVDYWNYFDKFALQGHIVNNFIVFYLALFRSLSFYFFLNLFFVLMFYVIASQRIKYDSNRIRTSSGLQSQCDLNMAQIITKKYKTQAFYEVLNLRKKIWVLQCFTFLLVISLGYPSSLLKNLYKIKEKQKVQLEARGENVDVLKESIASSKDLIFKLIFLGVYKDESPEFKFNFYIDFIFVIIGLFFENQCINWLENRFGCNYFRFQKFIELDMRRQAQLNSWGNKTPEYRIENYRKHYFRENFEELKVKFTHSTHADFIQFKQDQLKKKAQNTEGTQKFFKQISENVKDKNNMKNIKLGEFLPTTNYDLQNLTHSFGDYIPQKQAVSIREMIKFSLLIDCEAPDIVKDNQTKKLLKEKDLDYESIPILREYKIKQLRSFLQYNIQTKYKISLAKGFMMVVENIIMMLMMISLVLKCNLFSLVYLLLVLRYPTVDSKTDFLIRMIFYQAICLLINYFLILLNLNPKISPRSFPSPFSQFPGDWINETKNEPIYFAPFFFNFSYIRDNLSNGIMFGLGIDKTQFYSLFIDLINVFITSAYVIHFKNPILAQSMKKVFWEFPIPFNEKKLKEKQFDKQQTDQYRDDEENDQKEDWDRLDDLVKKQVLFLRNPLPLNDVFNTDQRNKKFQDIKLPSSLTNEIATNQYNFIIECKQKGQTDKNKILKTYTDISSQNIWSEKNIKSKKKELKLNSGVYRIVKKGSISIYLFLHVFTLFIILFMGVLRQSLLSLGYVIILIPHLSKASDVLKQRQGNLEKQLEKVKNEGKLIQTQYEELFYASIAHKFKMKAFGKFMPQKIIGHNNMKKLSYLLFSEKLDLEILEKEEIKRIISLDKNLKSYNENSQAIKVKEDKLKERLKMETDRQYWEPNDNNLFYLILIHACHQFQQKEQDKLEEEIWDKWEQKQKKIDEIKREISANKQREIRAGDYVQGRKTSAWSLITVLQNTLIFYALIDLILSIIFQLPIIQDNDIFKIIGLKKIFTFNNHTEQGSNILTFQQYLDLKIESLIDFNIINCQMQTFNCLIVAIIFLQCNIFDSPGYFKFISQENSSMDLFIKLSDLKARLLTYISNNQKLNTVQQNQKWRKKILDVVETIKKKVDKLRKIEKKNFELKEESSDDDQINQNEKEQKYEQEQEQEQQKTIEVEEQYFWLRRKVKKEAVKEQSKDDLGFSGDFIGKDVVKKLSDKEFQEKIEELASDYVKDKMKKFGCCARYYQWFNKEYCQSLILNDNEEELKNLKENLARGKIQLHTSLEKTFRSEVTEFIYSYYSTSEKKRAFELELDKYKDQKSVYKISDIKQKLRVEDMPLMSEFFSGYSLYIRYFETLSLMLISQSQNLIFISMILSMYVNAGLVSLFYPFAVFGYGLLEEKRPGKAFWKIVLTYSICLLFAKILINLEIIQVYVFTNQHYLNYTKNLPIEFLATNDGVSSFVFLLPEAMIVCFIMLNQIKLKMLGLDYQSENDIEIIHDAITRVEAEGDEKKIAEKREEELNDNMCVFFDSFQKQKLVRQAEINEEKQAIYLKLSDISQEQLKIKYKDKTIEQIAEEQSNKKFSYKHLLEEQEIVFYEVCDNLHFTSRKFDLDSAGVHSFTDDLIEWNCIQKVLENDSLTYVEGFRKKNQNKFMTEEEFNEHKLKKENWEVMSADDFDVFEEEQQDYLNKRKEQKIIGWMDKNQYFKRLFPPVQIQKPGEDYLGSITFSLIFILYYLFAKFDEFTFSQQSLEFMQDEASFFSQEFIFVALIVIFVLLFERIANRTNTIKKKNNLLDVQVESNQQTHKHHSHHHNEQGTLNNDDQLDNKFEVKDFKTIEDQNSQYKVSSQQKWKYYLHILMLILGHIYIFFIVPIKSNISLYGSPICDVNKKDLYGCFNFHDNPPLRHLYLLLVLYLWFSAQQISQGFPMKRKASLLLEDYWWGPRLWTDIVTQIPFFVEIRCLIDYMSTKTSLDYSQFIQLFIYHKRLYGCAVGNRSYDSRKIGAQQTFCDMWLCGHLTTLLFFILIIGPLLLFSQFSPLLGNNPVEVINLNVHFDVQSLLTSKEGQLKQLSSKNYWQFNENQKNMTIQHQMIYKIYENQNAYQRQFIKDSDNFINKSNPEMLNFEDDSIQVIELRQYSDKQWESSFENRQQLQRDMQRISNDAFIPEIMNFSLAFDFEFKRKQPDTALIASIQQKKVLNVSNYFDCMTALELQQVSKINCDHNIEQPKSVIFSQVYFPGISLGQTQNGQLLNNQNERLEDQQFDVKLTLSCNNKQPFWSIEGNTTVNNLVKNLNLTDNSDKTIEDILLVKNPQTCELINQEKRCELQKLRNLTLDLTDVECFGNTTDKTKGNVPNPGFVWTRIKLAVFSLQVTTSFLASYTVGTFYLLILFSISGILRSIFVADYWIAKFIESTHVMPLIKICEACYIYRHEEDLVKEEETYRILQEALRSDALFKALSGSSLKGEIDPQFDNLDKDQKKKLLQLEKLEQKGFEVSNLKKKILQNKFQGQDEFEDLTQDHELK